MLNFNYKLLTQISTAIFTLWVAEAFATTVSSSSPTYQNEQAIVFETKDGKKTDAFSGFLQVPENRSNPASRKISIHYVRFPATGNQSGSPIIYLSGGPGGSGISTAKAPNGRFPLFMALREFGDVIALDQRGTGLAKDTPECLSSQATSMTQAQTEEEVTALHRLAAKECTAFWQKAGIDILGYTTVESAHDLNALRLHLKAKKITLWGISYGSHLAFAALKQYPNQIDKVVIASAEGLNQTVKLPAQSDAYFDRLQQAINTQASAAALYPDIKALIKRVHAQLEAKPLPLKLTQKDGSELDFLFQKQHLQALTSGMVADPQTVVVLLKLYSNLDAGSVDILNAVLKRGYFHDNRIRFEAMPFAMDIASGITDERLKQVKAQAKTSLLGLELNFPMPQLNKQVPNLDLGDVFRANPQSAVPTLLLSGTLDGRTFPEEQYEATSGLTNLKTVTVKNAGHNLFMSSPEVTKVIKEFLAGKPLSHSTITVELPDFSK
nr:alpha/beta hydrolase [uncultured Undibacterium sp.]